MGTWTWGVGGLVMGFVYLVECLVWQEGEGIMW